MNFVFGCVDVKACDLSWTLTWVSKGGVKSILRVPAASALLASAEIARGPKQAGARACGESALVGRGARFGLAVIVEAAWAVVAILSTMFPFHFAGDLRWVTGAAVR
jgi:hypothetical protein